MANAWHHAVSSARIFGGEPQPYTPLHEWFDETKILINDFRHRALRHHAQGVMECQRTFGVTITNSNGRKVPVEWVAVQHVREDLGFVPEAADWLRTLRVQPWMMRGAPVGMEPGEIEIIPPKHRRFNDAPCDVCGGPAEEISGRCDWCSQRIAAEMLREEIVDGQPVWREWRREWIPGGILRRREHGHSQTDRERQEDAAASAR